MKLQLLVFIVASLRGAETCTRADCHGVPCPDYQVLKCSEEYEVRFYGNTEWLTTPIKSHNVFHLYSARSRLQAVADACSPKVDSWPVLVNVDEEENTFSLSWFLPPGTNCMIADSAVTRQKMPPAKVYARSYQGPPDPSLAEQQKNQLLLALQDAHNTLEAPGGPVDAQRSTWAGYDLYPALPYHSEVWVKGHE